MVWSTLAVTNHFLAPRNPTVSSASKVNSSLRLLESVLLPRTYFYHCKHGTDVEKRELDRLRNQFRNREETFQSRDSFAAVRLFSHYDLRSLAHAPTMPLWTSSRSPPADEEETASLTRTPWSPVEAPDSDDILPANSSNAEKGLLPTRRSWTPVPEVRRWRGTRLLLAASMVLALGGGFLHFFGYLQDSGARYKDRGQPWKKFGNSESVDLSVKEADLPPCERTMLVDWVSSRRFFPPFIQYHA